ncbi:MAG: hypothetical protein WDM94_12915 [Bauldia sp.]
MGIVHSGVPHRLALWLRDALPAADFVETGTNLGGTVTWAGRNFQHAVSIEADRRLYERARGMLASSRNIELRFGQSQDELVPVVTTVRGPAVIWLDAHWSGEGTAGEAMECPLLQEIDAVDAGQFQHAILIDDARLFLNPPPPPHKADQWPTIGAVVDRLRARFADAFVMVSDDVIVRVPAALRSPLEQFMGRESRPVRAIRRWLRGR